MSRSAARVATALLLLPAGPAAAETFYNQDGVLMSATATAPLLQDRAVVPRAVSATTISRATRKFFAPPSMGNVVFVFGLSD